MISHSKNNINDNGKAVEDSLKMLSCIFEKELTAPLILLWKKQLKFYDPSDIYLATEKVISSNKYFPKPAHILAELKKIKEVKTNQKVFLEKTPIAIRNKRIEELEHEVFYRSREIKKYDSPNVVKEMKNLLEIAKKQLYKIKKEKKSYEI